MKNTIKICNLVWIDMEMTGLIPEKDFILEIAIVISNANLDILDKKSYVIYQKDSVLSKMDLWNKTQHTKSGLIEKVKKSKNNEIMVEKDILDFIMHYVLPNKSPMCGSSICQDRRFLYKHMPFLENYFHYRNLDVSSIKILANKWMDKKTLELYKKEFSKKDKQHIALEDIIHSINELKFYRKYFFKL